MTEEILKEFSSLEDNRQEGKKLHPLPEILLLTIVAAIAGAEGWRDIEIFGNSKLEYLKKYLPYNNGIPSKATLQRVFSMLDPEHFKLSFLNWVKQIYQLSPQVIPVDGKTLRRSYDKAQEKPALQMVSAFASQAGLVLAQQKVDNESNEITAIPKLLELFDVRGNIVTIDAIGCQKEIAATIVDKEADYVLSLKKNQLDLYDDVSVLFDDQMACNFQDIQADCFESVSGEHGRVEVRKYYATEDIEWIRQQHAFEGFRSVAMVESFRTVNDQTSTHRRIYISSLPADAKKIASAIRSHWSIENSLHWVLDVSFNEDYSRIRDENASQNIAILRHTVFNCFKMAKPHYPKYSLKGLKRAAAWDEGVLDHIFSLSFS